MIICRTTTPLPLETCEDNHEAQSIPGHNTVLIITITILVEVRIKMVQYNMKLLINYINQSINVILKTSKDIIVILTIIINSLS